MDKAEIAKPYKLGDPSGDVIVKLTNNEARPEWFYSHSSVLINKSKYFADRLSPPKPNACVEIQCTVFNYDHHVNLLKLLYLDEDLVLDSLESVRYALGVLQVAVALHCEEIAQRCVEYLEANPWEDKEEEEIVKVVLKIGTIAMPILARIQPVDLSAAKDVFVSAMHFATSNGGSYPDFGDELKISAQEQVEYMLGEDEDAPLVIAEEEVRSVVKTGLSNICSTFQNDMHSLLGESDPTSDSVASKASRGVSDLEWMCNILPKMDLMKDFVLTWVEISADVLTVVDDKKLDNLFWGLKVKLIELTGKVLEAVGYGNVILPSASRVQLLKTWLPYIRKTKPALDSKSNEDAGFEHGMDDDLCQSIEGAIVSLILALPSNDQADILTDWMNAAEQVRYPDLSEAFDATVLNSSLYTVDGGQRAVLFDRIRGVLDDSVGEGTHFLVPWLQKPFIFDIRTQPHTFSSVSGTKDMQMVNLTLRLLSRPEVSRLPKIFQNLGLEYQEKVLPSIGNEIVKAVVAQFNADQLLTERPHVSALVRDSLIKRAAEFNIQLDDVAITHLSYSPEFSRAVEQKQVAQQEAERSKFVVQKADQERRAAVIRAEGESEAAKLISDATLKVGMGLIELRKIEASREIAATLAKSPNVSYLPGGNQMLMALNPSTGR